MHPYSKMTILSLFIHPHIISKLYDLFSSVEHEKSYFEKSLSESVKWKSPKWFGYHRSSKYHFVCSSKDKKVVWNDMSIFIFAWTMPNYCQISQLTQQYATSANDVFLWRDDCKCKHCLLFNRRYDMHCSFANRMFCWQLNYWHHFLK